VRPQRHIRAGAFFAALALTLSAAPASAQGLFDFLFGRPQPRQYEPPSSAYTDPYAPPPEQAPPQGPAVVTGPAVSFCVRLCDGRYFPMQPYANVSPAQICSSLCPASKTQVYHGGAIDYAVAANGTRYTELNTAFVYRKQIVAGCTCNGRDTFGLAPIGTAADPTLRPGDIVVTAEGPMSYRGGQWTRAAIDIRPAVQPKAATPAEPIEPGDQSQAND